MLSATVVIATYNRGALLVGLLKDLDAQHHRSFDIVIIDDGSKEPASQHIHPQHYKTKVRLERQPNGGAAAARDHGISLASGDVIIILDDDMSVGPDFVAAHLQEHDQGFAVVLGNIRPAPQLDHMPLFERFHQHQLDSFIDEHRFTREVHDGTALCTGNVSFRRELYLSVGGFDKSLKRSEDRELGVRFQQSGAKMVFSEQAKSVHRSDHESLDVWMKRALLYGIYDSKISEKHPQLLESDPWRFLGMVNPVSRPLLVAAAIAPRPAEWLGKAAYQAASWFDKKGQTKIAVAGTTLTYGIQYFRGIAEENMFVAATIADALDYWRRARKAQGLSIEGSRAPLEFVRCVFKDFAEIQRTRKKWFREDKSLTSLPTDAVKKIGFQMMLAIRFMHLCRDSGLTLMAQASSRMIRHLYAAEIHWDAQVAAGVGIVHGNGLVLSHASKVGEGCILFHNVTLGEANHPDTRQLGAPTLGKHVHIGPGATLLGPIHIGDHAKILAGALVTRDVPARAVVRPAEVIVEVRDERKLEALREAKEATAKDVQAVATHEPKDPRKKKR